MGEDGLFAISEYLKLFSIKISRRRKKERKKDLLFSSTIQVEDGQTTKFYQLILKLFIYRYCELFIRKRSWKEYFSFLSWYESYNSSRKMDIDDFIRRAFPRTISPAMEEWKTSVTKGELLPGRFWKIRRVQRLQWPRHGTNRVFQTAYPSSKCVGSPSALKDRRKWPVHGEKWKSTQYLIRKMGPGTVIYRSILPR